MTSAERVAHRGRMSPAPIRRFLFDSSTRDNDNGAEAVALDDAIGEYVGAGRAPATVRTWVNNRAVVVPRWRLRGIGRQVVVDRHGERWQFCGRGSGGGAVAHGPGVLNVSLILPVAHAPSWPIDRAFQFWVAIVSGALQATYGVDARATAVNEAFCVGRYDLAVSGRKLAGTAQFRRNSAVVVHGTVLASVDCVAYCDLVSAAEQLIGIRDPACHIRPDRTISLKETIGREPDIPVLADAIATAAAHTSSVRFNSWGSALQGERERASQLSRLDNCLGVAEDIARDGTELSVA